MNTQKVKRRKNDSSTPLAQYFPRICIVLRVKDSENEKDYEVISDDMITWIRKYDSWYQRVLKIKNSNSYRLESRSISLFGSGLLSIPGIIRKFSRLADELGIRFYTSVELNEAITREPLLNELVSDQVIRQLFVLENNCMDISSVSSVKRMVSFLLSNDVLIEWVGTVEYLLSSGVLDMDIFNAAYVVVHNSAVNRVDDSEDPSTPCLETLGVYINRKGNIYPCLPLVSIPQAVLGTIYDGIETTALASNKTGIDLHSLITDGPELDMTCDHLDGPRFIKKCRIHRNMFSATEKMDDSPR